MRASTFARSSGATPPTPPAFPFRRTEVPLSDPEFGRGKGRGPLREIYAEKMKITGGGCEGHLEFMQNRRGRINPYIKQITAGGRGGAIPDTSRQMDCVLK